MDNKCAPLLSPRTFFRLNFIQEQGDWKTLLQISFYMYIVQYYQRHRIFSRNTCWLVVSSRRSTWTRPAGLAITVSTQLPDLKLLYGATCSLPAGPDTCYHPVTYIVYNLKGQCHANDVRLVLTHWSYEGVQVGLISLYRGPRAPCFWTKHVLPSSVLLKGTVPSQWFEVCFVLRGADWLLQPRARPDTRTIQWRFDWLLRFLQKRRGSGGFTFFPPLKIEISKIF